LVRVTVIGGKKRVGSVDKREREGNLKRWRNKGISREKQPFELSRAKRRLKKPNPQGGWNIQKKKRDGVHVIQ